MGGVDDRKGIKMSSIRVKIETIRQHSKGKSLGGSQTIPGKAS